jgi:hypothetical protein
VLLVAHSSIVRCGMAARSAARVTYSIRFNAAPCSRSSRLSSRNWSRQPPLNPRMADRALPASDFGPVDFSHGRHCRINSARKALCSGVRK